MSTAHSFTVLRLLPPEALSTIVFPGDSTIVSTLFNPKVQLTNTLVRNAVFQVKSVCRDIVALCPQAIVYLDWIAGDDNPADLNSKLHMKPFMAVNSGMYRHASSLYIEISLLTADTFL